MRGGEGKWVDPRHTQNPIWFPLGCHICLHVMCESGCCDVFVNRMSHCCAAFVVWWDNLTYAGYGGCLILRLVGCADIQP